MVASYRPSNSNGSTADDILQKLEAGQKQLSEKIDLQLQKLDDLLQQGQMKKQQLYSSEVTPVNDFQMPVCRSHTVQSHTTMPLLTPSPAHGKGQAPVCAELRLSSEIARREKTLKAVQGALGWQKSLIDMFAVNPEADFVTRCVSGYLWTALSLGVIIVSSIVVGIETHLSTAHAVNQALSMEDNMADYDSATFRYIEIAILGWTVIEVLLNAYAQRWNFICGMDAAWNAFDVVILIIMISTTILQFASASFLRVSRVARLFRMGKVLRVFRVVKFLRSIRSMMISIAGSLLHLLSALLVMCVFMFVASMMIMQSISGDIVALHPQPSSDPPMVKHVFDVSEEQSDIELIATCYGTLPKTMMTLFLSISGGLEWRLSAGPLAKLGWYYAFIWTTYIAFMVFGLLNVLTGIFCQNALGAANNDRDNIIQAHLEERDGFIHTIAAIFKNSDKEGSGELTEQDMAELLQDPQLIHYFNAIGLDVTEAMGLFQLLDDDESGTVSIDEFVTGFLRLKGNAKAVDMVTLMYETRKISKLVKATLRETWTFRTTLAALQQGSEQVVRVRTVEAEQPSAWRQMSGRRVI